MAHSTASPNAVAARVTTRSFMRSLRLTVEAPFYTQDSYVEHFMPDATQRAAGKTVLVVDDHDGTRQTIARMLEAGGFSVRTASNGAEALERLAEGE